MFMNIEGRSGISLKNCISVCMIISFSLICILGLIAIIKAVIEISFFYALLIAVICCICLFFVYLSSLLLYSFGELVENSATIVDILKSSPSKESVVAQKADPMPTPQASAMLANSTPSEPENDVPDSTPPQVEDYEPGSWLCVCGKRNDPSRTYCLTCGRVPKSK